MAPRPECRMAESSAGDLQVNPFPALGLLLVLSACAPVAAPGAGHASRESSRPSSTASPDAPSIARGAAFAQTQCSGCHAVGRAGDSAMPTAPPLRELGRNYPVAQLAEAFAEGIVTAHPAMPEFTLTQDENRDLIAYLTSIQSSDGR